MIDVASWDMASTALGGGGVLTLLVMLVRNMRRMYYTEKKDTAVDQASTSVYDMLTKENKRMGEQLTTMSAMLERLGSANNELTKKVSELTTEVHKLRSFEEENIDLAARMQLKSELIKELQELVESLRAENAILQANKLGGSNG